MIAFPERFVVTGTDTDVGKTLVSALLMLALDCRYFKPVQSGTEGETDRACVQRLSKLPGERFIPECYVTLTPCSPHLSARIDGIHIDIEEIIKQVEQIQGPLLIEGAGGLFVPLNQGEFILDLIRKLGYQVILVARSGLGTINHTLLSIQALRRAGVELFGVIMNGPKNQENRQAIETFGETAVLAEVPQLENLSSSALLHCAQQLFRRDCP